MTKIDLDPASVPEIGAHKSFEIEIALPEGVTRDVVLTDDLVTGTTSYVLESNASFPVEIEFIGIASINGQPPSEAALTGVPADGTRDTAVWSVGLVVTETDQWVDSADAPVHAGQAGDGGVVSGHAGQETGELRKAGTGTTIRPVDQ